MDFSGTTGEYEWVGFLRKMNSFYEIDSSSYRKDEDYKRTIVFLKDKKVDFVIHFWFESDIHDRIIGFQIHTTEENGILINWNETGEFALNEYHLGHGIRNWQNLSNWKSPDNNVIGYFISRIENENIDRKMKKTILEILANQIEKRKSE